MFPPHPFRFWPTCRSRLILSILLDLFMPIFHWKRLNCRQEQRRDAGASYLLPCCLAAPRISARVAFRAMDWRSDSGAPGRPLAPSFVSHLDLSCVFVEFTASDPRIFYVHLLLSLQSKFPVSYLSFLYDRLLLTYFDFLKIKMLPNYKA